MDLATLKSLAADAANRETFTWRGHEITVRGLTAGEQLEISKLVEEERTGALAAFAVRCMMNGTGPICSPEEAEGVAAELPADLVNKAWQVVARLSGLGEAETQEIEADFTKGQSGAS